MRSGLTEATRDLREMLEEAGEQGTWQLSEDGDGEEEEETIDGVSDSERLVVL